MFGVGVEMASFSEELSTTRAKYIFVKNIFGDDFMNVLFTGIPAVGKSTIAKEFSKIMKYNLYCDKDFITTKDSKTISEYGHKLKDVDLKKFSATVNKKLDKKKNIVLDGIIFPYCLSNLKLKLDYIFILNLSEKKLRQRYKKRKYAEAKILDNLFVQENNLIYKEVLENIRKKDVPLIVEVNLSGKVGLDITKIETAIYSTYSSI